MRFPGFMGLALIVAGCASARGAQPAPAAAAAPGANEHGTQMGMGTMGGMCPMQVPGSTVTAADVEGGVALSFTTNTGDVADLRQRVRRMAEMHNQMHPKGGVMGGGMMSDGMMMPAATASVEDVTGGARLILRPTDPAQLDALREHARTQAARMAQGECPMMAR